MADYLMNKLQNRLIGDLPKIGIRAVIDGRRNGVRESLEEQTMTMAKSDAVHPDAPGDRTGWREWTS